MTEEKMSTNDHDDTKAWAVCLGDDPGTVYVVHLQKAEAERVANFLGGFVRPLVFGDLK